MTIIAWCVLAIFALVTVAEPFLFGQPRKPYSAAGWAQEFIVRVPITLLCGRVLGWW